MSSATMGGAGAGGAGAGGAGAGGAGTGGAGTGGAGTGGAGGAGAGGAGAGGAGGAGAGGAGAGGAGGAGAGGAGGAGGSGGGGTGPCFNAWTGDFQFGTGDDDEILALAMDQDGSVYFTGYEHGIIGISNITPAGDSSMVIAKLDVSGVAQWKTDLDTISTDTGESLIVSSIDGNLYVVGRTSGAFAGFANQGQFDLVAAILNKSSGDVIDLSQVGTERPQHPRQVVLNQNGDLTIAGFDDTYVPMMAVYDWENPILASFSVCMQKELVPTLFLQANTIYPDIVTGVAAEGDWLFVSGHASGGPQTGAFVQQFTTTGTPGWVKMFSTVSVDYTNAVAISPTGDLYATGATFLKLGPESFGQQDVFLAKLDKVTGQAVWVVQAGTSEPDWPTGIAFDSSGNVYVSGTTLGGFPGYQNQGDDDIFVLKFDAAGGLDFAWQKGSSAWDNVSGMVVDACGNVLVGGFTEGSLIDGAINQGGRDMFLLKVQ